MFHSFFGGVNPAPHKENTRRKPIAQLEQPPRRVYLPLTSGRDQALLPAVKPGDTVQVGQPVAISRGLESTVHASVSGRVTAIADCPHAKLGTVSAIVIENDGRDTPWSGRPEPLIPEQVNLELLLGRVREAGITGMGGSGFPTAEKLRQAAGRVDTLIVNAAECEP